MSNSSTVQKNSSKEATNVTTKTVSNNEKNKIIDTIIKPLSFQEILRNRDKVFREEYNRIDYSYSTTVDYKDKCVFKPYKLFLSNHKMYILNLPKPNNKKKSKSLRNSLNFQYFNGHNLRYPKLSLNFDLLTAQLLINSKDFIMTILILGCKRVFEIRINNNKEIFEKYAYLINQAIITSQGYMSNLFGVCYRTEKFYKFNYISNIEFIRKAKTGDLLIFRGIDCPSPLQRFFTGDEYDHVALVKNNGGYLSIYEATTLQKCNLLSWQSFVFSLFNLVYDKIVYRRLLYDTSDQKKAKEIQSNIEKKASEFIEETKKKDYAFSVCSVICWGEPRDFEKKNEWKKCKGFSCSSLLTGAYYKMGVLEITKDTRSVLPGHFAQKDNKTLTFAPGFSLGPEEIIEFSI